MTKKTTKVIWLCCSILWGVMAAMRFVDGDITMGFVNLFVGAMCLLNVFLVKRRTVNPENEILWIVEDEEEEEIDEE